MCRKGMVEAHAGAARREIRIGWRQSARSLAGWGSRRIRIDHVKPKLHDVPFILDFSIVIFLKHTPSAWKPEKHCFKLGGKLHI